MSSIPRGVGGPPPPGTHSTRGKLMCIKVRLLDDSVAVFHLGHKALGETLMDEVARHLNLLERDYFGLVFVECSGLQCWLEMEKPILRQIANTRADAKFYLIVKFYTPNPVDLEEEYTRYLFTLQLRRDLSNGELLCAESTAALLAAYMVQSECGDFSEEDYPDATYLSHSRFVPNQTMEFQQQVMSHHRRLIGMSPAESDLALLEVARRCEFYGIKLHPAKDFEGSEASLAVAHMGMKVVKEWKVLKWLGQKGATVLNCLEAVLYRVFHNYQCVTTFSWAKVRKLSFKRKKLLIKLHPDASAFYKETVEFLFETRNECKSFWKKCVEQHAFFRCLSAEVTKKDTRLFSSGSSFRYRGRTHKELIDYVREHHKRREPFTRPLRSATTARTTYCSSLSGGYISDPGGCGTARSLPALRDSSGSTGVPLDARASHSGAVSSRHRNKRPNAAGTGPPPEQATSDVEIGGASSRYKHHHHCSANQALSNASYKQAGVDQVTQEPQAVENMSLSLPNVLDEIELLNNEVSREDHNECPPKSASGESFFADCSRQSVGPHQDYDNVSEDSYRLSEHEKLPAPPPHRMPDTSDDAPCYGFTVHQKKERCEREASAPQPRTPGLSSFASKSEMKRCRPLSTDTTSGYAVLMPQRRHVEVRPSKEYPFHTPAPLVPVPIDASAIALASTPDALRVPIYTASGALLLKPKIIRAEEDPRNSNGYSVITREEREPKAAELPVATPSSSSYSAAYSTIDMSSTRSFDPGLSVAALSPETTGAETSVSRPLPGKIITKEQLMITPEGVKERVKPAPGPPPTVPPKPRLDSTLSGPIIDAEGNIVGRTRPTLISVRSEDTPDIEKYHLFNSSIPYTLTLRKVQSVSQEEAGGANYSTHSLGREGSSAGSSSAGVPLRRKSVDIVPRRRLPSPASYSSQDHSIEATTPDQGDLFEYVLRRRSMSQERSALAKRGHESRGCGKRGDPRRATQPVRFNLPPSPTGTVPSTSFGSGAGSAPYLLQDDEQEELTSECRSLHEDMERLEGAAVSISSFSSQIPDNTCSQDSFDKGTPDEALPPPPPPLPHTMKTFKPAPPPVAPKPAPPVPPPKPAASEPVPFKPAANVVSIRTTFLEREVIVGDNTKNSACSESMHNVEVRVEREEEKLKETPQSESLPEKKASPPFIDDSPKSSKGSDTNAPASKRTSCGLQWTDF